MIEGPSFKFGDMFSTLGNENSLFVVTANSDIKLNGELVMGAGIALQLRNACREAGFNICSRAAKYIRLSPEPVIMTDEGLYYGFVLVPPYNAGSQNSILRQWFGLLQVKYSWRKASSLCLVKNPGFKARAC